MSPARTQLADAVGDRDEEAVAGDVAEGVVDDLEVVEVDEQDDRREARPAGARSAR